MHAAEEKVHAEDILAQTAPREVPRESGQNEPQRRPLPHSHPESGKPRHPSERSSVLEGTSGMGQTKDLSSSVVPVKTKG